MFAWILLNNVVCSTCNFYNLGADLNGIKYTHPINKTELPFLAGNHVTSGKGTGLVHTAPAHGRVDFQVALRNNIVVVSTKNS